MLMPHLVVGELLWQEGKFPMGSLYEPNGVFACSGSLMYSGDLLVLLALFRTQAFHRTLPSENCTFLY